jgi:hypothetical protein
MYTARVASRRTQIYLDEDLRERIERVRSRRGDTMADVVRDALDLFLRADERSTRPLAEVAEAWVGAWREEKSTPDTRAGLEDRARRLGY